MSLYWLEPGWTSAECARCGRNIWDSGGDPDWGLCFECFSAGVERRRAEARKRCAQELTEEDAKP